jgi:hypothetical protein
MAPSQPGRRWVSAAVVAAASGEGPQQGQQVRGLRLVLATALLCCFLYSREGLLPDLAVRRGRPPRKRLLLTDSPLRLCT